MDDNARDAAPDLDQASDHADGTDCPEHTDCDHDDHQEPGLERGYNYYGQEQS